MKKSLFVLLSVVTFSQLGQAASSYTCKLFDFTLLLGGVTTMFCFDKDSDKNDYWRTRFENLDRIPEGKTIRVARKDHYYTDNINILNEEVNPKEIVLIRFYNIGDHFGVGSGTLNIKCSSPLETGSMVGARAGLVLHGGAMAGNGNKCYFNGTSAIYEIGASASKINVYKCKDESGNLNTGCFDKADQ